MAGFMGDADGHRNSTAVRQGRKPDPPNLQTAKFPGRAGSGHRLPSGLPSFPRGRSTGPTVGLWGSHPRSILWMLWSTGRAAKLPGWRGEGRC